MPRDAARLGRARSAARLALAAAALATAAGGAAALAQVGAGGGATVARPAVRVDPGLEDVAVVFDLQDVDAEVVAATFAAAEQAGAAAAPARTASVGLRAVTRAGAVVHAAPDGFLIPMVLLAMPRAALGGVVGDDIPGELDDGTVMMNELTAQTTGAQQGDTLELRGLDGSSQWFRVGRVLAYARVGGAELLMTPGAADRLGVVGDTEMIVWDIRSRSAFETAVQNLGLTGRPNTKVERSWDARDPDDALSTARLKSMVGAPWYQVVSGDTIEMHPIWKATYLPPGQVLLSPAIPIRARCHNAVSGSLRAALDEVAAAGLAAAIDVANTNTYGGCFNPRYSRISGFLSRHAYAVALDMNTTSNCQGCTPRMNCDVVRIFRKHGFAWGGNWRTPDGMHFEWVGERRDQLAYPSRFCPNVAGGVPQSVDPDGATATQVGLDVLIAGLESGSAS
ncbi:MAG TPA: M15 family metallopeptidase [Ilumatobacter sp.]|nr:M15 family metallopeptidase [Ilumatobacter sp.]